MLSIMVVRYSIGWSGRVERGRCVAGCGSEGDTGLKGFEGLGGLALLALSERRRVRPGKAGLSCGGGAVRRVERMADMFYVRCQYRHCFALLA